MRAAKLADLASRFANNKYGRPGMQLDQAAVRDPASRPAAQQLRIDLDGRNLATDQFSLPVVVRSDQAVMLTDMNQQARRLICARVCARARRDWLRWGRRRRPGTTSCHRFAEANVVIKDCPRRRRRASYGS
jgi:hypothetical protein